MALKTHHKIPRITHKKVKKARKITKATKRSLNTANKAKIAGISAPTITANASVTPSLHLSLSTALFPRAATFSTMTTQPRPAFHVPFALQKPSFTSTTPISTHIRHHTTSIRSVLSIPLPARTTVLKAPATSLSLSTKRQIKKLNHVMARALFSSTPASTTTKDVNTQESDVDADGHIKFSLKNIPKIIKKYGLTFVGTAFVVLIAWYAIAYALVEYGPINAPTALEWVKQNIPFVYEQGLQAMKYLPQSALDFIEKHPELSLHLGTACLLANMSDTPRWIITFILTKKIYDFKENAAKKLATPTPSTRSCATTGAKCCKCCSRCPTTWPTTTPKAFCFKKRYPKCLKRSL